MHVMNKHVIVCLVNASSFGGEVFLRVSRQVRFLEHSLLDRALVSLWSLLSQVARHVSSGLGVGPHHTGAPESRVGWQVQQADRARR